MLGQALRQLEDDRGLADADASQHDVRPAMRPVLQVVHDHVAQLVAPDDVAHDGARRLDQLARLVARTDEDGRADPA